MLSWPKELQATRGQVENIVPASWTYMFRRGSLQRNKEGWRASMSWTPSRWRKMRARLG